MHTRDVGERHFCKTFVHCANARERPWTAEVFYGPSRRVALCSIVQQFGRIEDRGTTPASNHWECVRSDDVLACTRLKKEETSLTVDQLRGDWRLLKVLVDLMEGRGMGITVGTA